MKAGHPVEILDRHKLQVHLFIYFTGVVTTALLSLRHTVNKHYVLCVKTLNWVWVVNRTRHLRTSCWTLGNSDQHFSLFSVVRYNQQINRQLNNRYVWLCVVQEQQTSEAEVVVFSVPSYACQRRTTLEHHNAVLTVRPPANTNLHVRKSNLCVVTLCVMCVSCLRTLWRSWLRTLSSARRKDEVSLFAGPPPCWRLCPDRWRAWRSSEGFPVSEITRSESSRSAESVISRLASSSHSERI